MNQAGGNAPAMTAAHIAVAIVAACGVTGTKPDRAFDNGDGQGRTRVMAAAGCVARLGWPKAEAARLFRVHPNRLTPSGLQLARVWTEHLLTIAEALAQHGLAAQDDARTRFLRPYGPRAAAGGGEPPGHSPPAAASKRKAGSGEAEAETTVRAEAPAEPESPRIAAPRRTVTRRSAGSGAPIPVRPGARAQGTERLRPVTDRVIRWTRQQLALGVDIDFVAWCFGVDAEALADRVRPEVGVAA